MSGRLLLSTCLLALTCAPAAMAGDALPAETLQAIKNATVFIQTPAGSGSGFLFQVDGDAGYLVTNHHVLYPSRVIKGRVVPTVPVVGAAPKKDITVVFFSGTKKELVLQAEELATDPERDLAVLKVGNGRNLPAPLDIRQEARPMETMQVYGFGFPFGKALTTTRGHPAMTVTKGSVSSVRTNDQDEVARVQIDGALNPGNSGGPVVDVKGRLIGVVNSGIQGAGIAFAIPPHELRRTLLGRPGGYTLVSKKKGQDSYEVDVTIRLIDPLRKIQRVTVLYLPHDAPDAPKPGKERLDANPNAKRLELRVEQGVATGTLQVAATDKARPSILWQTAYLNGEGATVFTASRTFALLSDNTGTPVVKNNDTPAGNLATVIPGDLFAYLQTAVREKRTADVDVMGFKSSKDVYRDVPEEGAVLIGFQVGLKEFFKNHVIDALRPIYRTKTGEKLGDWCGKVPAKPVTVKAKEGYVVGSISLRTGLLIDGFSLTFVKLDQGRLRAEDAYTSDWIGNDKGGSAARVGGPGAIFVGICGHRNNQGAPCSLGLVAVLRAKE